MPYVSVCHGVFDDLRSKIAHEKLEPPCTFDHRYANLSKRKHEEEEEEVPG